MESVNPVEIGGNARKFLTSPRLAELKKEFEQNGGEWKEFKIGELFSVSSNPQLNKESFHFSINGKYPYFTRTVFNNGILGYVDYLDDEHKISGNSIAVGMLGMQFFYMPSDFYAGQFTKTVFPKFNKFNEKLAIYFIAFFNKLQKMLQSVLVRDFEKIFCESTILLPATSDGTPDFSYMERYIGELEQARVSELAAYLRAAGLENYDLTAAEQTALDDFKNGKIRFKEFKIGELFDIVKGKRLTKENIKPGNINFLGAISSNNGIRERIETTTVWKPNCISVNYNGSVGCSFYQEEPFYASDDVNICYSKENWMLNRKRALFFCAVFKNFSQKFSYTQKWNKERMIESFVFLPITDNAPDFTFMESFIAAQQKLAIRDVVQWKDKVISETRKITKV